jgi:hypothetical protein
MREKGEEFYYCEQSAVDAGQVCGCDADAEGNEIWAK